MPGKLQTELQQAKPFTSLSEEALMNIWRSADVLEHPLRQLFKSHGISRTQYNVLRILRGAGPSGIPSGDIAERMLTRDPDITRLLDRLINTGLARRARSRSDRRVVFARITGDGLNLLESLDTPVQELTAGVLAHLSQSQLRTLIRLLEQARATIAVP
jgi:DNA-binding MarR family transcriptional regulator